MDCSNADMLKIAFSFLPGMKVREARDILSRVPSLADFFAMPDRELIHLCALRESVALMSARRSLLDRAARELDFVASSGITPRFFTDGDYPRRLLMCDDAPVLVYTLGQCDLSPQYAVSIVGTRHATRYGIDFTARLVHDLAAEYGSDIMIVSGLAYGIDVAAHKAALAEGVPTVAVGATPLNTIYPSDHRRVAAAMLKQGGALVSEYASDSRIYRGNFLARNRIVAGMSDVVVVVESDIRGGAMSTARMGADYNRDVMALPGRVTDTYSRGCNALIQSCRAAVIRDAGDLIDAAHWARRTQSAAEAQPALFAPLSAEQKAVVDYLRMHPDHTANEMCAGLHRSFAALSSLLMDMELSDIIVSLPGGRYSVTGG